MMKMMKNRSAWMKASGVLQCSIRIRSICVRSATFSARRRRAERPSVSFTRHDSRKHADILANKMEPSNKNPVSILATSSVTTVLIIIDKRASEIASVCIQVVISSNPSIWLWIRYYSMWGNNEKFSISPLLITFILAITIDISGEELTDLLLF